MSRLQYRDLLDKIDENLRSPGDFQRVLRLLGIEPSLDDGAEGVTDFKSLKEELENQNRLGADRLEEMKDLLQTMTKFNLLDEVKKFESKRKIFRNLLDKIILKVDKESSDVLEKVISMCRGDIAANAVRDLNVRTLFDQLETQERLRPNCLDILTQILRETGTEPDLLQEVEEFAAKWREIEEDERRRIERSFALRGESDSTDYTISASRPPY